MSYFEQLCRRRCRGPCFCTADILSPLLILLSSISLGFGTLPHCAPAAHMGHKARTGRTQYLELVDSGKRQRGDSNPCGQSPMDFESITLATRSHCLADFVSFSQVRYSQSQNLAIKCYPRWDSNPQSPP